ncbi:hypothetical protein AYI69_g6276 [Smittium culicis]|uniref:Uncharacterized protein n=1 Tax=Smittium culicis TaxID=133412 RepID=A0A1R1Y0R0_9FUNG|nr:hypothetical protein AYI69_g6276 [Smittium culicis]
MSNFPVRIGKIASSKNSSIQLSSDLGKNILINSQNNNLDNDSSEDISKNIPENTYTPSLGSSLFDFENVYLSTVQGQGAKIVDMSSQKVLKEWNLPGKPEFSSEIKYFKLSSKEPASEINEGELNVNGYLFAALDKSLEIPKGAEGKSIWRWTDVKDSNQNLEQLIKIPKNLFSGIKSKIYLIEPIDTEMGLALLVLFRDSSLRILSGDLKKILFTFPAYKDSNDKSVEFKVISCKFDLKRTKPTFPSNYKNKNLTKDPKILLVVTSSNKDKHHSGYILEHSFDLNSFEVNLINTYILPQIGNESPRSAHIDDSLKNVRLFNSRGDFVDTELASSNAISTHGLEKINLIIKKSFSLTGYLGFNEQSTWSNLKYPLNEILSKARFENEQPVYIVDLQNSIAAVIGLRIDSKGKASHNITVWDLKHSIILNELRIPDINIYSLLTSNSENLSIRVYYQAKLINSPTDSGNTNLSGSTNKVIGIVGSFGIINESGYTSWTTTTFLVNFELPKFSLALSIELNRNKDPSIKESDFFTENYKLTPSGSNTAPFSSIRSLLMSQNPISSKLVKLIKSNIDDQKTENKLLNYLLVLKEEDLAIFINHFIGFVNDNSPSPFFITSCVNIIINSLEQSRFKLGFLEFLLAKGLISYYLVKGDITLIQSLKKYLFDGDEIDQYIFSVIILVLEKVQDVTESDIVDLISSVSEKINKKQDVISFFRSKKRDPFFNKGKKSKKGKKGKKSNKTSHVLQHKTSVDLSETDSKIVEVFSILLYKSIISPVNEQRLRSCLSKMESFAVFLCLWLLESWVYESLDQKSPVELFSDTLENYINILSVAKDSSSKLRYIGAELKNSKEISRKLQDRTQHSIVWLNLIIDSHMNLLVIDKLYQSEDLLVFIDRTLDFSSVSTDYLIKYIVPHISPIVNSLNPKSDRTKNTASSKDSRKSSRHGLSEFDALYCIEAFHWN